MSKTENATWAFPDDNNTIAEGAGRTPTDFAKRDTLMAKLSEIAVHNGWSKSEAAKQIDMSDGKLSQWWSGKYTGRFDTVNREIQTWLDSYEDIKTATQAIPASPEFIELSISNEIHNALQAAQLMPTMVMVCCDAGMGKTMAVENYHQTRSHTFLATMSPHTRTVHGCLMELAEEIGLQTKNAGTVVRSIGERIRRRGAGSLLIVDEAQHLHDDAINQLRHFVDKYECGVALLGNTETYTKFGRDWTGGPKYAQLRSRFFKRVVKRRPEKKDLVKFIRACGVHDQDMIDFLVGIGMKPGALRDINLTVKFAKLLAIGAGRELEFEHLKAAWANRDVEAI